MTANAHAMTISTPARMSATLVALAALALCLVGGSASAAPVITCTNSASDQATVQTALDAGGIVTVKGTCLGNWTIAVPVALSGSGGAVLDGNFTGSVLTVTNATTAIVSNLTIRNGVSDAGGGLFADFDTTVTVRNSTITSNTADEAGGGIYAQDSALVTVSGGAITHNESGDAGGGIAVFGAELSATNANISSNLAVMGGGIAAQFSNASLLRTRVTGNTASDFAGGIASFASGSVEELNAPTVAASRNLPFSRLMRTRAAQLRAGDRAERLGAPARLHDRQLEHRPQHGSARGWRGHRQREPRREHAADGQEHEHLVQQRDGTARLPDRRRRDRERRRQPGGHGDARPHRARDRSGTTPGAASVAASTTSARAARRSSRSRTPRSRPPAA